MNRDVVIPEMPPPEVYELEYKYWPWGQLIAQVADLVVANAPRGGLITDYMCGTGYLLYRIANRRPDLRCCGVTNGKEDVAFARRRQRSLGVICADVMTFVPPEQVDIAISTGGIHHLVPLQQAEFLGRVARDLRTNGCFLVGEEVIRPFVSERGRKLGVLELGNALLTYTLEHDAPSIVIEAAFDVMKRDLFTAGEYKTSLYQLTTILETVFVVESCVKTWPLEDSEYGDYIFVCRAKSGQSILG